MTRSYVAHKANEVPLYIRQHGLQKIVGLKEAWTHPLNVHFSYCSVLFLISRIGQFNSCTGLNILFSRSTWSSFYLLSCRFMITFYLPTPIFTYSMYSVFVFVKHAVITSNILRALHLSMSISVKLCVFKPLFLSITVLYGSLALRLARPRIADGGDGLQI
jgi:hypothetical protein